MSYMPRETIVCFLKKQSMDDIIRACNDVYIYRFKAGVLPRDSIIHDFAKKLDYGDTRHICDVLESYVCDVLGNTIVLCLRTHPESFISYSHTG